MNKDYNETMMFQLPKENAIEPKDVLFQVFEALKQRV